MALVSFESTDDPQGHVDRSACRFLCGASFVIPVVIGFRGEDVEDSYSYYSADSDDSSLSRNDGGFDEDYGYDDYDSDQEDDWNDY